MTALEDDGTRSAVAVAYKVILPRLKADGWHVMVEGGDGLGALLHERRGRKLIHSIARELDGHIWAHVSISNRSGFMPSWGQVRDAWWICYPDLPGVVVIAPRSNHVNLGEVAHVWGRLDGDTVPDFTHQSGSI